MRLFRSAVLSFAVVVVLLSLIAVAPLSAQPAAPCRVTGTVRNASQQPFAGVTVQFSRSGSGQSFAVSTDANGQYCARGLAPGSYLVNATRFGFAMNRLANGAAPTVTVTDNPTPVTFDITMRLATQTVESLKGGDAKIVAGPPAETPHMPPPPPTPLHAETAKPTPQAVQKDATPEDIGEAEAKWFGQLKTGAIQYDVPQQMTLGQASSVSVTIFGYQAPVPATTDPQQQTAPLKVSNFMRVTIAQNDNPDEFTIAQGQNADEQFVPVNGSASWTWNVTPKHLGKDLKLQLQAFVLYSDPKQGIQQSFPAASRQVTVVAEGVKGIVSNARDSFWSDPSVWIKYMLPGGAGFAALAAVIGWWVKRKKPDAPKGPKE